MRRRRKKRSNLKAMLCISVVAALLLIGFTHKSQGLIKKNAEYAAKESILRAELEKEKQRAEEIEELQAYMQTDEYVEKVAKDKLGLVYKDEILFRPER